MIYKNDILTVEVTDINYSGLGIARHNGEVIFIQGGVTEDILKIKIIKTAKKYCVARTEEILSPSPYRINPVCPFYKRCGGCVYQHISYEYENRLKENRVREEFRKSGFTEIRTEPITYLSCYGYRNKLQCPVSENGKIGFYAQKSHEIIPIESCLLQEKNTEPIFSFIKKYLSESPGSDLRHIYLRCGTKTGEVMVCFVAKKQNSTNVYPLLKCLTQRFPQIKSIILNINPDDTNVILGDKCITLYGNNYIEDILCGLRFRISPLSFYQVNHNCTELLYKTAAEFADIKPTDTVCDLYCGTGTIGLCVNSLTPAKKLIGVEIIPSAVENAKYNAISNGVTNAEFYCSAAENFDFGKPDVLICDPPRKGLIPSLIQTISNAEPKRIVYISCSPDTLARDCSLLKKSGYSVLRVKPFNMFPRTGHVETIVCLERK